MEDSEISMGIKTETFFDDAARRRNRVIYLLCGLVTVACLVTILVLSSEEKKKPSREEGPAAAAAPREPPEPAASSHPSSGGESPASPEPATMAPRGPVAAARVHFDRALDLLREARDLGPGSEEGTALKHEALKALTEAKAIYEEWLEAHPEDEEEYGEKIASIQRQIFWTKRNMSASDFPDQPEGGTGEPPGEAGREGSRPVDVPTPLHTPPKPGLPPETVAKHFLTDAARAFRRGDPFSIVEKGRAFLKDDGLSAYHEQIGKITEAAADMVAFLRAAEKTLADRAGQSVTLTLRNGEASGVLVSAGDEIVLRGAGGDVRYPIADLEARALIDLAEKAGHFSSGRAHGAAGSYLYQRGDRDAGFEEFVRARAEGVDLGPIGPIVAKAVEKSRSLKALADWLALEPRLGEESEEVLALISAFRASHFDSSEFRDHREEIFRAAATAAAAHPFSLSELFHIAAKPSSRGKVKLRWPFDDPMEIDDFGQRGKAWTVSSGALLGEKGSLWIEKFDLDAADVTVTVPGPTSFILGLWSRDRSGRGGVNLRIYPKDDRTVFELRHGDRSFGSEKVRLPKGELSISLLRREDRYQVRVNRKTLLRATDSTRYAGEALHTVGLAAPYGPVTVEDLQIASTLDMEWAKGGGNRFATWIKSWYVAGPFPVSPQALKSALVREEWPETTEFDPTARDENGKPLWRVLTSASKWVDLNRLRPNRNVVAYHAIRVWSPDKRSAVLELVCDDAARVWLNGDLVIRSAPLFEPQRATVRLRPGDNVLLVKVLQSGGAWWSATRFLSKSGAPMRDLSYW